MATTTPITTPPRIDYTSRDYNTNLQALKDMVAAQAPSSFTSFFEGDLGQVLLEAMAYEATMGTFTMDMLTQECFIDTLVNRESLLHFSRLTGYTLRRATAVQMELYCRAATAPAPTDLYYLIAQGTQIKSKDGQVWEVVADTQIPKGSFTPVTVENQYGLVTGQSTDSNGNSISVPALVHLINGSATAVLCDKNGIRWDSSVNFGLQVSQGSILILTAQQTTPGTFGSAPDAQHQEYAIISLGKLSYDVYGNTILYLDRPWDQTDYVGQWRIENRNVLVQQGETHTDTFLIPSGATLANYTVQPAFYPVLSGGSESFIPSGYFGSGKNDYGVVVTVNGVKWTPTASLLFNTPTDQVFEVTFDVLDRVQIRFGDGMFGSLLPVQEDGTVSVDVTYRVGGGSAGNLPQNSFDTTLQASIPTQPSTPVTVYVTNPYTVGTGGQDRETITEGKKNIPQFVRTNDRAVTVEDYAYLASNFSDVQAGRIQLAKGVLHTNMVPREQNVVWVYCWVAGANGQLAPPTFTLKSRLLDYLNQRKMITDEVVIIDGPITPVPIWARYQYAKQAQASEVSYQVQAAINGVLKKLTPGDPLYLSHLYEAIGAVPDVLYLDFVSPSGNVVAANEYEVLSNSLQLPQTCALTQQAYGGAATIVVNNSSLFSASGYVGIWEANKVPTVAVVDNVASSVVTLRTPLQDSYTTAAVVTNSDLLLQAWAYERSVDLYVTYSSGTGTSSVLNRAIQDVLTTYFTRTLQPQEVLLQSTLVTLLSAIPDVASVTVNFDAPDSLTVSVTPAANEIVRVGVLTINSIPVQ